MPAWIEVLLAEDWSDRLEELRDYFVEKMAPDGSGYERRFAAKYGVLYAVGKVAVENGVLDWPADWPAKAVARCYRNALAAANREKTQMTRALARLQKAVSDGRFVVPLAVGRRIIVVSENDYGVICRYKGPEVVAVTDAALQSICGDRLVMKALVSFLKTKQVYKGGHGHAGTTQVPIKVRIGGKVVDKPRFWIFDREALMQLRRAPPKTASAPRSRGSVSAMWHSRYLRFAFAGGTLPRDRGALAVLGGARRNCISASRSKIQDRGLSTTLPPIRTLIGTCVVPAWPWPPL